MALATASAVARLRMAGVGVGVLLAAVAVGGEKWGGLDPAWVVLALGNLAGRLAPVALVWAGEVIDSLTKP